MQNDPDSLFRPLMKVINGVAWQTEGSTLLARQDDGVLGKKMAERYLFRTANGNYFEQVHHAGLGKNHKLRSDEILPLTTAEALKRYTAFPWKYLPPAQAFPDMRQA